MENTELAYDYRATASILDGLGYDMEYIKDFLTRHQNASGYIKSSCIPESWSDAHMMMGGLL